MVINIFRKQTELRPSTLAKVIIWATLFVHQNTHFISIFYCHFTVFISLVSDVISVGANVHWYWYCCADGVHFTLSKFVLPVKHYYHYYIAQFHLTIKLVYCYSFDLNGNVVADECVVRTDLGVWMRAGGRTYTWDIYTYTRTHIHSDFLFVSSSFSG